MAEWSLQDLDGPLNQFGGAYPYPLYPSCYPEKQAQRMPECMAPHRVPHSPPSQAQPCITQPSNMALHLTPQLQYPKGDNPRELRKRAEKMRRDRLNQSVAELAAMVPPVVAARRKIDKTTVLRLTAHYLRAHQYVFGDSIGKVEHEFTPASAMKVLSLFNGFLITTTYRGIIVVVSQNVHQYLGYTELELLGQNLLNITHEDDRAILREQLLPTSQTLGSNGELILPNDPEAARKVEETLAQEKRQFVVRLKKLGQRSEPNQYVRCHIQGSLRKSDRACPGTLRTYQVVRRARARTENPCSSGNDIVFIGIVRPTTETFINESALESYRMEYRTRHSIDGEIIQCESRIALVTGYMTHEVSGINAMNFMHRDDVRWVIIALREMYDQHRLFGESCYRLMTKNGQFIYMRTRGRLDVDKDSRAVTSFVCTNTVVGEDEGKHLIKLMRNKFHLLVNNNNRSQVEEEIKDVTDNQPIAVEDPRRLEQVIMHLVTNLPSPGPNEAEDVIENDIPEKCVSPAHRLTIIPPNKERIVSAIEKIYSVIKTFPTEESWTEDQIPNGDSYSKTTPIPDHDNTSENNLILTKETKNDTLNSFILNSEREYESTPRTSIDSQNDLSTESLFNTELSQKNFLISETDNLNSNPDNINGQYKIAMPEVKYQTAEPELNFSVVHYDDDSSVIRALPEPSTSNYSSGIKRPNEFEDQEVICKRKIGNNIGTIEHINSDSPTLDSFFDETLFNTQIESAINSLESIDPTFPDLLIEIETTVDPNIHIGDFPEYE